MAPVRTPPPQTKEESGGGIEIDAFQLEPKVAQIGGASEEKSKHVVQNGDDKAVEANGKIETDDMRNAVEHHCAQEDEEDEIAFLNFAQVERTRLLIPPLNFALVNKGVYRSGYPNKKNFSFLEALGIRTIVCLSTEENANIKQENQEFIKRNMITQICVPIKGQKEPFTVTREDDIREVLRHVLDVRNHPLLVHCDKGKHRVGCVVACLRKLEGWSLASIFREYELFSRKNARWMDLQLIELFTMPMIQVDVNQLPSFLKLN